MAVQAVIFRDSKYTADTARKWLHKHGYKAIKRVHKTKNFLRYRILDPSAFSRFSNYRISKNIYLVIGYR